ncbi:hypothetical protein [Paraburkholderia sp.]|nr:hypothetical protein [Paraburkholderia sp.]
MNKEQTSLVVAIWQRVLCNILGFRQTVYRRGLAANRLIIFE